MAAECGTDLTVSRVKPLSDFSGNRYFVVEFEPTGYLICHGEYGETLEYAEESPSPYLGMEGDLLYAGPTYYYSLKDEMFSNPIFGEEVSTNDTDYLAALSDASNELDSEIATNAEFCVDLTQNATSIAGDLLCIENTTFSSNVDSMPTPTGTKYYVPDNDRGVKMKALTSASQIGYWENDGNGVCGYIATGLLLYWFDEVLEHDECVNDFTYISSDHNGFLNGDLTRELRSYGDEDGSDAMGIFGESIIKVIRNYNSDHKIDILGIANLLVGKSVALKCLKNNNKPVIIFGRLTKNGTTYVDHAVFAYGYTSDDQILVHYGHPNYSEVVLKEKYSFDPSIIAIKGLRVDSINLSDVPSNFWGNAAIQYCERFNILNASGSYFKPEDATTRRDFVAALYKLAGKPEVHNNSLGAFVDAPSEENDPESYNAAQWAVENNILNGVSSNTLGLSESLTREQAAVFLRRYSTYLSCTFTDITGPDYTTFSDYRTVSPFARSGVDWATRRYLLRGDTGKLYPSRVLTRAETAQLIYNLTIRARR